MKKTQRIVVILIVLFLGLSLAACQQQTAAAIEPTKVLSETPTESQANEPAPTTGSEEVKDPTATTTGQTETPQEEATSTEEEPTDLPPTATADIRLDPEDWRNWPVVPEISGHAIDLYNQALADGADPTHFSKIGDCQNVTSYFLADFDRNRYRLGEEYAYLQEVIDHFAGSWKRESMAVKGGFNVASVLNPMLSNPEYCEPNETPLDCEFRLHNPSIVIISMETWWNHDNPEKYEFYMRNLLDQVLEKGALPIIATKADNLEGDHTINRSIAQLAYEYDIPMWNFWAATDPLPAHGLVEDGFHLTLGLGNYFDNPDNFAGAWPIRNLTALQTMDAVYQAVNAADQ